MVISALLSSDMFYNTPMDRYIPFLIAYLISPSVFIVGIILTVVIALLLVSIDLPLLLTIALVVLLVSIGKFVIKVLRNRLHPLKRKQPYPPQFWQWR